MDDADQTKVVNEANALGMSVKKITDQLRETEAVNEALRDVVSRQDEELARKDEIIADLSIKLDDALADLSNKHDALVSINATVRESFARQRGTPKKPEQPQLARAHLPPEQPIPRIVRQGPAAG
jgi:DNA-binding transcriptional MerR regulator